MANVVVVPDAGPEGVRRPDPLISPPPLTFSTQQVLRWNGISWRVSVSFFFFDGSTCFNWARSSAKRHIMMCVCFFLLRQIMMCVRIYHRTRILDCTYNNCQNPILCLLSQLSCRRIIPGPKSFFCNFGGWTNARTTGD